MANEHYPLFTFDLVSPEALLFSQPVEMVVIPGAAGDMGVLSGHAPTITTLRPGVVEVHQPGHGLRKLFVAGGIAEVRPEKTTVLAEEAIDLYEFTADDATVRLQEAQAILEDVRQSADEVALARAAKDLKIAEALLLAAA